MGKNQLTKSGEYTYYIGELNANRAGVIVRTWQALIVFLVLYGGRQALSQDTPFALSAIHRESGDPWRWSGNLTMNFRGIGQRPLEVEVENQLVLSDVFMRLEGPVLEGTPFLAEFSFDTEGQPHLYRLAVKYLPVKRVAFELGRFLVPFGSFNELYRPDLYPLLTKPLLFATPGLDYVSRVNHPHPVFSSGYTDTGLLVHYYPHAEPLWFPSSLSLFVVNGLGEGPNNGRPPSTPHAFFAFSPVEGVDIDWGHERTFLLDNNDTKTFGGRIHYDFGDVTLPDPLRKSIFIDGVSFGVSAMNGKYDIEDQLNYWAVGVDATARRNEYRFTTEWVTGPSDFRAENILFVSTTTTLGQAEFIKDRYATTGGHVQIEFPFPEFPLSLQTNAIVTLGQLVRRGPVLTKAGELSSDQPNVHTQINKYSLGFNSVISPNFNFKFEFAYWDFNHFGDIYQWIVGGVLSF